MGTEAGGVERRELTMTTGDQSMNDTETATEPDTAPDAPKNIHAAIIAVRERVAYVQKKKLPNSQLNYAFASVEEMIRQVRVQMNRYGIGIYTVEMTVISNDTLTTAKGGTMFNTKVAVAFEFVHGESDTRQRVQVIGEAADTGDKSVNKAATAAFKMALRQTFVIETGETDPDNHASMAASRVADDTYKAKRDAAEKALRACRALEQLHATWKKVVEYKFPDHHLKDLRDIHNERLRSMEAARPNQEEPDPRYSDPRKACELPERPKFEQPKRKAGAK